MVVVVMLVLLVFLLQAYYGLSIGREVACRRQWQKDTARPIKANRYIHLQKVRTPAVLVTTDTKNSTNKSGLANEFSSSLEPL